MVVAPAIINLNQHHGFDIASRSHQESLLSATQPCTNVISSHPPTPGSRSLPPRSPVRSGWQALNHSFYSIAPGFNIPHSGVPTGRDDGHSTLSFSSHCPGFQPPTLRSPDRSGRRTFIPLHFPQLPRVSTRGEEDRTLIYAFAAFSTRCCNDLSAIFPIKIKGC